MTVYNSFSFGCYGYLTHLTLYHVMVLAIISRFVYDVITAIPVSLRPHAIPTLILSDEHRTTICVLHLHWLYKNEKNMMVNYTSSRRAAHVDQEAGRRDLSLCASCASSSRRVSVGVNSATLSRSFAPISCCNSMFASSATRCMSKST